MSWASDTKVRLQFAAIGLTVMCPSFLIWMAGETRRQIASTSWPSVPGEVSRIFAKPWLDRDNNTKYYGRVAYRYSVDGQEYTSDLTDLGPGAKRRDGAMALADVAEYQPGMTVPVYYDPRDPGVGVLKTGIPTNHLVLQIGLCVGTLIGSVVSFNTARGWIRSARQKPAESSSTPDLSTPHRVGQSAPVELGDRIETFKPRLANIVAGGVISLLLIGAGIAIVGLISREVYLAGGKLPFDAKQGMSWIAVGIGSPIGVGLAVGGVLLIRYLRWLLRHEVGICTNGFRYQQGDESDDVLWRDVASIRETIVYERPPILKGPAKLLLPKLASKSYTVITKAGMEYGFNGDSVRNLKRFAELLREQGNRARISWDTIEEHC